MNRQKGTLLCGILSGFMVINLAAASVVVMRWQNRLDGTAPSNSIESAIDYIYGNEKLEKVFPNMQFD